MDGVFVQSINSILCEWGTSLTKYQAKKTMNKIKNKTNTPNILSISPRFEETD